MTTACSITAEQIWCWLREVPDPEIPVISITDLGIVRDVSCDVAHAGRWTITVTPTYSGCPATEVIAASIRQRLAERGVGELELRVQLFPPWTTDWLTDTGRQCLQEYGIAPPAQMAQPLVHIAATDTQGAIRCPLCGSARTELLSQFSSTPCKALHRCLACREPFDYFKPH